MTLYHSSIGFPAIMKKPSGSFFLTYSAHAEMAAQNDRYGKIQLPKVLDTRNAVLFEAEYDETTNIVRKAAYRLPYNEQYDLCMVFAPNQRKVITVWLNDKNDTHRTLNSSRYAKVSA